MVQETRRFHGAKDAIFISNEQAQFVNYNRAAEILTGYSSDDLSSMSIRDLHEPEDLTAFKTFFPRIISGEEITSEAKILRKDGTKISVEFSNKSLEIDGKRYMHTIARDISRRKLAEEKLVRSEREYRELFENSPVGIFQTDLRGNPLTVNPEMARIVGAESPGDAVAKFQNLSETLYVNPERRGLLLKILKNQGFVNNFPLEAKRLDGKTIILSVNARVREKLPDGTFIIDGFTSDITDQKKVEEALSENYKKYFNFLNNTTEGIYMQQLKKPVKTSLPLEKQIDEVYENAYFAECNDALVRMYGLSNQKELLGKKLVDFHGGKNNPVNRAEMRRFIKNGYRESSEISHETCADGKKRWFLNTTTGVVEDGKLLYLWGTHTDITEIRRAEEEIIKLSEAIAQLEEIVVITDSEGNIHYTNPAFEKVTGYPGGKFLGQKPSLLRSGKQDQKFYSGLWKTITKGKRWTGNLTNKRSNGSFFTTYSTISPVRNQEGEITNFVWISRDITEELSLKKSIEQAQRMEAVGTLAGGIAHDFNNILTSVLGFTELALNDAEKGSVLEERLQAVYSAGGRARDLVKQILAFARKTDEVTKPIQVDAILKEALNFLRPTIPTTIEINQDINSYSLIMGAPTQVHQIIMNLCTNAAQAMENDGGVLKVSLRDIRLASGFTKKHVALKPGDYLELKISDTGKGIPPGIIESIFEPYFTTKAPGEGTGMGLATVHGIVKKYSGEILVESKLNKGTEFTVYLPVCRKRVKTKRQKFENLPGGSENILVVDDEMQVAEITGLTLRRLGYNVTTLTSSMEALELFRSDPDAFDLVITDMTMPGLTGDNLTSKLLSIKPGLPVILCSGYAKKIAGKEAKIKGIRSFAYKPIPSADLANLVRGVLDGNQGSQDSEAVE
ncbi:MAG: PAS domain S-box protein [Acidobacteriota bacterium]